jgi:hypothetical protein
LESEEERGALVDDSMSSSKEQEEIVGDRSLPLIPSHRSLGREARESYRARLTG